jgi:hypothetical protein
MKQLVNNNCKQLLDTVVERLTDEDEPFTDWDVERLTDDDEPFADWDVERLIGGDDGKRLSD